MPYVERAENEEIIGVYATLQPGFAEELLEDEDSELALFLIPKPTSADVDVEKERRLTMGMTYYNPLNEINYIIQMRDKDMLYLLSMSNLALDRRENYPETVIPEYLQWIDFTTDFYINDVDNNTMRIDAFEIINLQYLIAIKRNEHIAAAQALKDMGNIPIDYTDDSYWPIAIT